MEQGISMVISPCCNNTICFQWGLFKIIDKNANFFFFKLKIHNVFLIWNSFFSTLGSTLKYIWPEHSNRCGLKTKTKAFYIYTVYLLPFTFVFILISFLFCKHDLSQSTLRTKSAMKQTVSCFVNMICELPAYPLIQKHSLTAGLSVDTFTTYWIIQNSFILTYFQTLK